MRHGEGGCDDVLQSQSLYEGLDLRLYGDEGWDGERGAECLMAIGMRDIPPASLGISSFLSNATANARVMSKSDPPMGNIINTHSYAGAGRPQTEESSGNGHTPAQQVFPSTSHSVSIRLRRGMRRSKCTSACIKVYVHVCFRGGGEREITNRREQAGLRAEGFRTSSRRLVDKTIVVLYSSVGDSV